MALCLGLRGQHLVRMELSGDSAGGKRIDRVMVSDTQ